MIYHLYTDGACQPNPGQGGWAYILYPKGYPKKQVVESGYVPQTTNNRMEIIAVLEGLKYVSGLNLFSNQSEQSIIKLFSDSKYILDGLSVWMHNWASNGWKKKNKKPILNRDLWEQLYELYNKITIECIHIKGHSGHLENEECDRLAVKQISENNPDG